MVFIVKGYKRMDVNIIAWINILIGEGIKIGLTVLIVCGIVTIRSLNKKIQKINEKVESFNECL